MPTSTQTYQDTTRTPEDRVNHLLNQMSLPEKIGQMTQVEKNSITPEDVTTYFIGSILSGGGGSPTPNTAETWRQMVLTFINAALETPLAIPLIYGVDAVHGHSNVKDTVIFPHNIGLGATRNPDLIRQIAEATAREILATGVQWNFAPAVSVPQDIRWGRTYEGYSENTDLVSELGVAYIQGLHAIQSDGAWVLPSVKHFVADGGTDWNSRPPTPWIMGNWQAADGWSIDQGDASIDEDTLRTLHLAPYQAAVDAGVLNIMASFSSWHGTKMHEHQYLLTDVLKGEMGFKGFVVSDWMAIDQIEEDFYNCVVRSINAGVDMIMVPFDYKRFIQALTTAVQNGDVAQARIDDAVRRILYAKIMLGIFENPIPNASFLETVGSEAHRDIARAAAQQSAVLLKNESALPLPHNAKIYVAGQGADDIGLACGGWTIEWQGAAGDITAGSTLLDGLKANHEDTTQVIYRENANFGDEKASVGVVVIAEAPYAEGQGDNEAPILPETDVALIRKVRQTCDKLVLVLYSGRPVIITEIVDDCDAIIAAWLPGCEASPIADLLYGTTPFTGKLSMSYPRNMAQVPLSALKASDEAPLWAYGHGLTIQI
ncbi:MAG: glycoside hydrolase family 3 protein [Aggregatilineales bacterium]